MITINRPLYTYDQFTNNPFKLLAQKYLPRKYLRKLWKATTYSLHIPNKHLTNNSINNDLIDWLNTIKHNIKIWYQPTTIRIEFKYLHDAVTFRQLWN